jgi:Zn-dependent protease
MYDLTLQTMLFQALSLLLIAAVDGFVITLVARAFGDPGPAQDGRLTFNPLTHVDMLGGLGALVFGLGWIKPIAVTPSALRSKLLASVAIVLAGSIATLVFAVLVSLLLPPVALTLSSTGAPLAADFIAKFVAVALGFALLNLVPLPPLAGGYVLDVLWPDAAAFLRKHAVIVGIVLLAVLATGYPTRIVAAIAGPLSRALLHQG